MAIQPINAIEGFRCAGVAAGIKASGALDLGLLVADAPCRAAATFTTNKVCAAPVRISREHLARSRQRIRAVVVNSGNANACTDPQGLRDARTMCRVTAGLLGIEPHEVLVASTGPIGVRLPMDKVTAGIEQAAAALSPGTKAGRDFARAILTTDNGPKTASESYAVGRDTGLVAGAAKGAGMICPRMATMLAFLTTDLALPATQLRQHLRAAVGESFNAITVDGHTSTNDSVFLLSTAARRATTGTATRNFGGALTSVCRRLAEMIVLDGEGATKATAITVRGARSAAAAERIARTVAESPLVRTALFGNNPNWGRLTSAVGYAEGVGSVAKLRCTINDTVVFRRGRSVPFDAAKVSKSMNAKHVRIELDLAEGRGQATILTSDLTHEYIRINAEMHT